MISYVAAVATAVTQVQRPIEVFGGLVPYILSSAEQEVLRRTLLRSVRVVHPGKLGE